MILLTRTHTATAWTNSPSSHHRESHPIGIRRPDSCRHSTWSFSTARSWGMHLRTIYPPRIPHGLSLKSSSSTHHLHQVIHLHISINHPNIDQPHWPIISTNWLNTHFHTSSSGLVSLYWRVYLPDSSRLVSAVPQHRLRLLSALSSSLSICVNLQKEKSIQLSVTVSWIALNCDSPDRFQQSVNKSSITAKSLVSSSVTWHNIWYISISQISIYTNFIKLYCQYSREKPSGLSRLSERAYTIVKNNI